MNLGPGTYLGEIRRQAEDWPWYWEKRWKEFFPSATRYQNSSAIAIAIEGIRKETVAKFGQGGVNSINADKYHGIYQRVAKSRRVGWSGFDNLYFNQFPIKEDTLYSFDFPINKFYTFRTEDKFFSDFKRIYRVNYDVDVFKSEPAFVAYSSRNGMTISKIRVLVQVNPDVEPRDGVDTGWRGEGSQGYASFQVLQDFSYRRDERTTSGWSEFEFPYFDRTQLLIKFRDNDAELFGENIASESAADAISLTGFGLRRIPGGPTNPGGPDLYQYSRIRLGIAWDWV